MVPFLVSPSPNSEGMEEFPTIPETMPADADVCFPHAFRFSLCSPVERLRQAFQILDPKNTSKVSAEHLRLLLRGIGCVWTEAKLAAALKSAGVQGTDRGGFCNCASAHA